MSGPLLIIASENGSSSVKPYGLSRSRSRNMKFALTCIVIVVSCSVCASGDLEIYPGLKYDISSDDQPVDDPPHHYGPLYRRYPWDVADAPPPPSDGDFLPQQASKLLDFASLAERLHRFKEFLSRNRHSAAEEELPFYYPDRTDAYDEDPPAYKFANPQILDDVRPYPHEDDFSFGGDDDADQEERSRESGAEEASGKGALDEAKFVEDPTEFAYLPTDPRFFQNSRYAPVAAQPQQKPPKPPLFEPAIELNQRSEERSSPSDESTFHSDFQEEDDRRSDNLPGVSVVAVRHPAVNPTESAGIYIIAVVAGVSAAATVGLIAIGIGWYNLQKHVKSASDVEYPAYGVTGPNKDVSPSGDRRLAQSAQMYHYQHQKQQIIAMESRAATGDRHGSVSEADSDEENEEGDYTVYECPGLAPTGEMEVKNPLFQDDPTPAKTPTVKDTNN